MSLGRFIDLKRYCCEHTAALSHCIYRNYAVMVIYVEHCRLMSPSLADNCRTYSVIIIVWLSKLCEHRYCCGDSVDNMGFWSFLNNTGGTFYTIQICCVRYFYLFFKICNKRIDVNAFTQKAPWTQNSSFKECLELSLIIFYWLLCYSYRSIQTCSYKDFLR